MGEIMTMQYPDDGPVYQIDSDKFEMPVYEDGKSHKDMGAKLTAYAADNRPYNPRAAARAAHAEEAKLAEAPKAAEKK